MTQLVFFLEERSAKEMLKGLLPKLLPEGFEVQYLVFEGKQDLEKRLPRRLRAWQRPDALFIVLRDKDSADCVEVKQRLTQICESAGRSDTLVRIACHELESWYLGDLAAVATAIGPDSIVRQQMGRRFRDPDRLANPFQELKRLAPEYQKVSGSRAIAPCLSIENNRSTSFNVFVSGIQRLIANGAITPAYSLSE